MKTSRYSFILVVLISFGFAFGCTGTQKDTSTQSTVKGKITSEPSNAEIYLTWENWLDETKKKSLGVTPLNYSISPNSKYEKIVAIKKGYKTKSKSVPASREPRYAGKNPSVDIHFELEKNIFGRIKDERSSYSKKYKSSALEVIGLLNKVLNSPRFQMASVTSEAQTRFSKLKLNFPDFKKSALNNGLKRTIEIASKLSRLDSSEYDSIKERRLAGKLKRNIQRLKSTIGL